MFKLIRTTVLFLFLAGNVAINSSIEARKTPRSAGTLSVKDTVPAKTFQCPMKCEGKRTYSAKGNCPICNMTLIEVYVSGVEPKSNHSLEVSDVHISGAMRNVMHKGELGGTIDLDTISNRVHLYGLGPVEYLTGEILIVDGKSYITTVRSGQSAMQMNESFHVKASFFVYANVNEWAESNLPDSISTVQNLEDYLNDVTVKSIRPFAFKVTGIVDEASIHVVNLPRGTKVNAPADAHKGQVSFELKNETVELVGFFSTEHQGVFAHHDEYSHIHLITSDGLKMGHLDSMKLKKGAAKLFLPN